MPPRKPLPIIYAFILTIALAAPACAASGDSVNLFGGDEGDNGSGKHVSLYSDPSPTGYKGNYAPAYVAPPAPPSTYVNQQQGTYCRKYSRQIRVDGKLRENYGTACLQPDGSWRGQ